MARKKIKAQPPVDLSLQVHSQGLPAAPSAAKKSRKKGKAKNRRPRRGGTLSSLKISNPYLYSLLVPEEHTGAKIPDQGLFETAVFDLSADLSFPQTTDGCTSMVINPLTACYKQQTTASGVVTASGATLQLVPSAATAYAAAFESVRLVSAVVTVEYEGNTLNDGGEIAIALLPYLDATYSPINLAAGSATAISVCSAQAQARRFPLRNGMRFPWKPQEPADFNFAPGNFFVATSGIPGTNNTSVTTLPNASWWIVFTSPSNNGNGTAGVVRLHFDMNYEAVPTSDYFFTIMTSPSMSSPLAMAEAENTISQLDLATPVQGSLFDRARGAAAGLATGFGSGLLKEASGWSGIGSSLASLGIQFARARMFGNNRHRSIQA